MKSPSPKEEGVAETACDKLMATPTPCASGGKEEEKNGNKTCEEGKGGEKLF